MKTGQPCADCGVSYPPRVMDFHHKDTTEKIDVISRMIGLNRPWNLVLEEIAKCELLCANCHRLRTFY